MRLAIIGTGYVGLVTGVCFADLGNTVTCVDIDEEKIRLLKNGTCPIYEPGLTERLERGLREQRLQFTTDEEEAISSAEVVFICVGTPPLPGGGVDLSAVESVAKRIGSCIDGEKIIVVKSTVPVGTTKRVGKTIASLVKQRKKRFAVHVASNPEFLREGAAVRDFFNPDRIVIGIAEGDAFAKGHLEQLYSGLARTTRPIIFTDTQSAELIKYASNAMLATRISFMNQLSAYCEAVGADITIVAKGMGLDDRIGPRFLHAGIGYGGSCFPKDVTGLIAGIKEAGCSATIFSAVHEANEQQKRSLFPKIKALLKTLKAKRVALWGLTFKPKTDDVREAPAHVITEWLLAQGATVTAFDPEGMENFRREHPEIVYAATPYEALKQVDLLILVTEWDEFRNPDWARVQELMRTPNIIDGRNIYHAQRAELKKRGFSYVGVGVPT